jgi:prefoldin subunit 5
MNLLEKEITTLTDQIERINSRVKEFADLKNELKGLKLFLGRSDPEFKNKFPEIMQKIYKKK